MGSKARSRSGSRTMMAVPSPTQEIISVSPSFSQCAKRSNNFPGNWSLAHPRGTTVFFCFFSDEEEHMVLLLLSSATCIYLEDLEIVSTFNMEPSGIRVVYQSRAGTTRMQNSRLEKEGFINGFGHSGTKRAIQLILRPIYIVSWSQTKYSLLTVNDTVRSEKKISLYCNYGSIFG